MRVRQNGNVGENGRRMDRFVSVQLNFLLLSVLLMILRLLCSMVHSSPCVDIWSRGTMPLTYPGVWVAHCLRLERSVEGSRTPPNFFLHPQLQLSVIVTAWSLCQSACLLPTTVLFSAFTVNLYKCLLFLSGNMISSWTAVFSLMKFCTNMYLDNRKNPVELQRSRSPYQIFGYFAIVT